MAVTTIATVFALVCAGQFAAASAGDAGVLTVERDFLAEQDQRKSFSDFVFPFHFAKNTFIKTSHGSLQLRAANTDPILGTLPGTGVAQALVKFEACAVNQPHVHPRGTEISFVTKGEVLFSLHEEDGGRLITKVVREGESIVIPQGLIHFDQNLGCKPVEFIASFPDRDPGTSTIASQLATFPFAAIRGTTGLTDHEVKRFIEAASNNPNPSVDPECLKRCGMHH